jgi:hypothetical protein
MRQYSAFLIAVAAFTASPLQGQQTARPLGNLAATGSPREPKVPMMWDRFYDHAAIGEIGRRLQAAHPNTCRVSSIGKSHEE